MPPIKHSEKKRFLLAHAIATIAGNNDLATKNIKFNDNWKESIGSIRFSVAEFTKILTREDINKKTGKQLYSISTDRNGNETICIDGLSYTSLGSISKKITRILKGDNFPTESSIREVVLLFTMASYRKKILFGSLVDGVDISILVANETKKILGYWNYVKNSNTEGDILTYSDYFSKDSEDKMNNNDVTTLQDILMYVDQSTLYINRYITMCNTDEHKRVLEYFLYILEQIKHDALLASEKNEDLNIYKNKIRERSFEIEKDLLRISLSTSDSISVYFSDSGFSDTGEAVWTYDIPRKEILRELLNAKIINNSITLVRVLLLDSLDATIYSENQLKTLALDIVTLLNHHVEVYVGSKKIAKEIDEDLFNYAILTDGTIMRASEGHTEWRVGKVGTGHQEYLKLLNNYKAILHESSGVDINFKPRTYLGMQKWNTFSDEECVEEIIYPLLAEWLTAATSKL